MRFHVFARVSALVALVCAGLGVASCTQDFDQFDPVGAGGASTGAASCLANEKSCNGMCVPAGDAAYGCGTSCTPCEVPNATPACTAGGSCTVGTCNAGFFDCDMDAINGCEAATATDPANCGTCGTVCTTINATPVCNAGACGLGACDAGFLDCDKNPGNGCEAPPATDPNNCGGCGTTCSPFETCKQGNCVQNPCMPGTADCNSDPMDGCETMLGTAQNCAFCKNACMFTNGAADCTNAKCTLGTCNAGFDDCNNMDVDGCEAPLDTTTNCGSCGNTCQAPANAMPTCTTGMCGFTCMAGFADCDNNPANGCEANLGTSATNCGACNYACSNTNAGSTACVAGVCAPMCAAGFGDCVKPAIPMADDGCETDVSANVDNCGACGRACSGAGVASKSCTAGVCDSTCDTGFDNCTLPAMGNDDGCETNVQTDSANCGSCGNACSGTLDCDRGNLNQKFCGCSNTMECGNSGTCIGINGTCVCGANTCKPGETCAVGGTCTCNGAAGCAGAGQTCCQSPAGCFNLTTDANNCGACGHQCPTGFICAAPMGIATCRCEADTDCNAGTTGTCNAGNGLCTCGGMQCATGERCLANGKCG